MSRESMKGTVLQVGTMRVEGEEVTGVFVEIDPKGLDGSFIYREVDIEKVDSNKS